MKLSNRDRGFLEEFIEVGWANHFVASRAFYDALFDTSQIKTVWGGNETNPLNQEFLDIQHDDSTLIPRIQRLCALRIWQEYFAAFEDAAAFLLGVRSRDRGILQTVCGYKPEDIPPFYVEAGDHTTGLDRLLGLPADVVKGRPWEWCRENLIALARDYNVALDRGVVALDTLKGVQTDNVFVMLRVNREGRGARPPSGMKVKELLNKLKHGFLATTNHWFYTSADASGLWVMPLDTSNKAIGTVMDNIDLVGRVCQRVARALLELDNTD